MLVLSRKVGERVLVGDKVVVTGVWDDAEEARTIGETVTHWMEARRRERE